MRVHKDTGIEVSDREIRNDPRKLSFNATTDLEPFGYAALIETPPPAAEEGTQVVRGPNALVKGQWQQTWAQEPIPPEPVPDVLSPAQGEYILIEMDLMDALKAAVAGIKNKKQREQTEVAVFRTSGWRRDSPTLNAMMVELGITEQQRDEMFIAGSKIEF